MKITIKVPKDKALYSHLAALGYDALDYSFPSYKKLDEIASSAYDLTFREEIGEIVSAGLSVWQCHLTYYPTHLEPLGDGSYAVYEAAFLPILEKEIRLAAEYGIKIAVIHLFVGADQASSRRGNLILLEKLLPILKATGVTLAIENIYNKGCTDAYLSSAEDLLYYVRHFDDRHIAVCFDSGHAVARGEKPLEMLRELGDKVAALHLHSNVPGKDLHLPPALLVSTFDWPSLGGVLREIGYAGSFNMEIVPWGLSGEDERAYYRMAYETAKQLLA